MGVNKESNKSMSEIAPAQRASTQDSSQSKVLKGAASDLGIFSLRRVKNNTQVKCSKNVYIYTYIYCTYPCSVCIIFKIVSSCAPAPESLLTHPYVSWYFFKKRRKRLHDFIASFLLGHPMLPDLSTGSHNAPPATGDTLFSVVAQDSVKTDMQIIIPYEQNKN